jgi:stage II sporulation protein D
MQHFATRPHLDGARLRSDAVGAGLVPAGPYVLAPSGAGNPTSRVASVLFLLVFLAYAGCSGKPEVANNLQQAATAALADREGAIVVMEPRTGRLRAVVNPRLAFEQSYPPGSTIKPFVTLAALRTGVLNRETQRQCQGGYFSHGADFACSHPRTSAPFDLVHALAYSCNDYYARVGERLSEGAFDSTLAAYGLDSPARDIAWRPAEVLGNSGRILVTPVQLVAAYSALLNGGHLFRPRPSANSEEIGREPISSSQRDALIEGMRGAVVYGSAASAGLEHLPQFVFGKTGTSTSSDGYHTQGWFVGFGAKDRAHRAEPEIAVVVFLKRSRGSESARVARGVFKAFAELPSLGNEALTTPVSTSERLIRVRRVSQGVTDNLSLDEYLAGVLAGESSVEDQPEALKAQAVASRTFAVKNLGRHSREGFDFCSTTHCQRYVAAAGVGKRTSISQAVLRTSGQILDDASGRPVDAYFHASCGGMTADVQSLWGITAPPYLRGVADDYCATMPHYRWTDVIGAHRLQEGLRGDPRTDTGSRLDRIEVTRRDHTGRVEWITLEGEQRKMVRGWDLKLIVGRALGWDLLKSSRFEVTRRGSSFVFQGGGFGHGLGLCQEGAHIMGRRGFGYRQILSHYFPGTSVSVLAPTAELSLAPKFETVNYVERQADERRVLSSEHFRINFPSRGDEADAGTALRILESAREDLIHRAGVEAISSPAPGVVGVNVHASTPEFVAASSQPGWVAGASNNRTIELQPLALLQKRGLLAATLRHEYAHVVMLNMGGGRVPRWLAEGLAAHFAGEERSLAAVPAVRLSRDELEKRFAHPASATEMQALYAASYREVRSLIAAKGEKAIWRQVWEIGHRD